MNCDMPVTIARSLCKYMTAARVPLCGHKAVMNPTLVWTFIQHGSAVGPARTFPDCSGQFFFGLPEPLQPGPL